MKTIRWTALGAAIFALFTGVVDVEAKMSSGYVSVSAVVKERCIPSVADLNIDEYSVEGSQDAVWVKRGKSGGTSANADVLRDRARVGVCRVPFQRVVTPDLNQKDLM
ncbi:MAG: hypothetical protein ACYC99_11485, partial [Candidatus Geothermincolia bacterium]